MSAGKEYLDNKESMAMGKGAEKRGDIRGYLNGLKNIDKIHQRLNGKEHLI